jgi:hypothetical protein
MKRLVTLILSAALLCPMWVGAQVPNSSTTQTTVGALGILKWRMSNASNGGSDSRRLMITPTSTLYGTTESIKYLLLNMLVPNNSSGIFPINGVVQVGEGSYVLPVSGTASTVDSNGSIDANYTTITLIFYVGLNLINCNLSASTLSGGCQSSSFYNGSFDGFGWSDITYQGLHTP